MYKEETGHKKATMYSLAIYEILLQLLPYWNENLVTDYIIGMKTS